MTYWTLDESDGLPAVTLCERHALEATNIGCSLFGLGPWETMQAAALELDTLVATFGSELGIGFETSEEGPCGRCEFNAEEGAA